MTTLEKAERARKASLGLANVPTGVKNTALLGMARAVNEGRGKILEANRRDVRDATRAGISKVLVKRLELTSSNIDDIAAGIRSVAGLDDPVGKTLAATELDKGLNLYRVSCPIGVIGAIFESRPDVVPQISSLCLKSGNAAILKGGSEAKRSNRVLFKILHDASAKEGIPKGWLQLLETRGETRQMLKLDDCIDLIIPRGSNRFVKYVRENTKIPVLGHSEGICHAYVDKDASLKKAIDVCYDAKVQYPAVCNAIETLLVHRSIANRFLPRMVEKYKRAGVEIRGDEKTRKIVKAKKATERDWSTEYNDLVISVKIVINIDDAMEHINTYGSGHTDAIITENKAAAKRFLRFVDSSSVMHNCSTRFADGFRYGLGAEVGISTNKVHARGPVGLEGLVIYKYVLEGKGQIVADYVGPKARKYTHRKLSKRWD